MDGESSLGLAALEWFANGRKAQGVPKSFADETRDRRFEIVDDLARLSPSLSLLINSENATRRFLGQFVCCAPKPCIVEIVLVQADYHKIGLVPSQGPDGRSSFTTLYDLADQDIEIALLGLYLLEESFDLSVVCMIASNGDPIISRFCDDLRDFIDSSGSGAGTCSRFRPVA